MFPEQLIAPVLTGFALGFAGSLHCVAMCGGILSIALVAGQGEDGQEAHMGKTLRRFLLLSLGRITSYMIAGAIVGSVGWGIFQALQLDNGHWVLRILSAMLIATIGALQLGLIPNVVAGGAARIVAPVSAGLNRLFARLPSTGLVGLVASGLAWGWLPCGLVYGGLTYAMLAGSAGAGASAMAGFGLGTIPALMGIALAAGLAGSNLRAFLQRRLVRQLSGLFLIAIAALSVIEHPANPFCQPLPV